MLFKRQWIKNFPFITGFIIIAASLGSVAATAPLAMSVEPPSLDSMDLIYEAQQQQKEKKHLRWALRDAFFDLMLPPSNHSSNNCLRRPYFIHQIFIDVSSWNPSKIQVLALPTRFSMPPGYYRSRH